MNFILPENFKMGHAEGMATGVTVIVCEKGATGGVSVRGGAPVRAKRIYSVRIRR